MRCKKSGRACGYETSAPGTSSSSASSPGILGVQLGSPKFALPENADWSELEKRSIDFYLKLSVPGIFSDVAGGFWGQVIPALCQQEPAIRYAVLAISSLHESGFYSSQTTDPSANPFAAAQYGKALRSLQKWQVPRDKNYAVETLIACALFICIEFMYGNFAAARIHISQGRRILAQFTYDTPPSTTELIRTHLVPIFIKLGVASLLFGSNPDPIPDRFRRTPELREPLDTMHFRTLAEAEQVMFEMVEEGLVFAKEGRQFSTRNIGSKAELEVQRDHWLSQLTKWQDAFAVLQIASYDPRYQVVQVYGNTMRIFLAMSLERPEMCYDDYTADFAGIVILCRRILDEVDAENRRHKQHPKALFSFDSGLIPPLYYVAHKCRHPGLRRSAIALMKQRAASCRRENMLAAEQAYRTAERSVALEEMRGWKILDGDARMGSPEVEEPVLLNKKVWVSLDWMPQMFDKDGEPLPHVESQLLEIEPQPKPIVQNDGCEDVSVPPPQKIRDFPELRRLVERSNIRLSPKLAAEAWAALEASSPLLSQEPEGWTTVADEAQAWVDMYDVPARLRIPKAARIYDAVVDPPVEGGSSVSFYVEPDPEDDSRLGVYKEFVEHG